MKKWISENYRTLIISAFLIPIITVAIVSISHVTVWYGISNPLTWAVYLSIGIEIAALSALAAISANMGSKVYFPFGIVTLIQFIGNIYFAYQYIDINSEQFKEWVELVSPLLEYIGVESDDMAGHRRFLSVFGGGMLPIISLSFLHMLVKFTRENSIEFDKTIKKDNEISSSDLVGEISKVRLSDEDLKILEETLLNPPKPNDNLKRAFDKYKDYKNKDLEPANYISKEDLKMVFGKKDDEQDIFKIDESYLDSIEDKKKQIEEDYDLFRDYEDLLNKEENKTYTAVKDQITDSVTIAPKNASEMMITSNNDIIESIPSDNEKSELDLPNENPPIAIEELPENQPIPDTPNPAEVKPIDEELEKKKN
jgi:hypothetical protein